jgi:hypothetical protein
VRVGDKRIIQKQLVNQIKMPFDFKFQVLGKEDGPLQIRPLHGMIPGLQSIRIEFIFEPTTSTTETLEAIFYMNELNFDPLKVGERVN